METDFISRTPNKSSRTAIIIGIPNVTQRDSANPFVIVVLRDAVLLAKRVFRWTNVWCQSPKSYARAMLAGMAYEWLVAGMLSAACSREDDVLGDQVVLEPWQHFHDTTPTLVQIFACR